MCLWIVFFILCFLISFLWLAIIVCTDASFFLEQFCHKRSGKSFAFSVKVVLKALANEICEVMWVQFSGYHSWQSILPFRQGFCHHTKFDRSKYVPVSQQVLPWCVSFNWKWARFKLRHQTLPLPYLLNCHCMYRQEAAAGVLRWKNHFSLLNVIILSLAS